jgi:hypothetical protein
MNTLQESLADTAKAEPLDSTGRLPRMFRLRQIMPTSPSVDHAALLRTQMEPVLKTLKQSARIAVAVGSRGIRDLSSIVSCLVSLLRSRGAKPYIVPAMGSHGGATADGQRQILASYGITEAALQVPIESSMDVVCIGHSAGGMPVWTGTAALQSDGILLVNRVKPHTDFGGSLGSGLVKMSVVGLGKREGALAFHAAAARHGHAPVLQELSRVTLSTLPILAGVAVIEGFHHETARLAVVGPAQIAECEPILLEEAARLLPRLPFSDLDLLIVDQIGKDISGTGMDPNVTGRYVEGYRSSLGKSPGAGPWIRRIVVRDLSPGSHGNAIGIGMADFTTERLVRSMDRSVTFTNATTALSLQAAKIPIYFEDDFQVLSNAVESLGLEPSRGARILRIKNTLCLAELEASESLWEAAQHRSDLELLSDPRPPRFDQQGNLLDG